MALRAAATVQARPQRVVWVLRGALLALCLVVGTARHHVIPSVAAVVVLLSVAWLTGQLSQESVLARLGRAAEVVVTCAAIVVTGRSASPFFVALIVPVLAAGLFSGALDAVLLTGLASAGVLVVGALGHLLGRVSYASSAGQAVMLALAIGLVAAWARRLLRLQPAVDQPLFATAYRLLTQLRTIARQLPGTLDPVAVASVLLDDLMREVGAHRGAVFARTDGGRLITLAGNADEAPHWDVDLAGDSLFGEAWTTQQPRSAAAPDDNWLVVLPLVLGIRTIGLVALEGDDHPPTESTQDTVLSTCSDAALRIETALLFAEVRGIATAEERQRLAREIHDGIAQELVIVGYGVDNALAELPPDAGEARSALQGLRIEVTRLISELRLSLFDLRSDIDPHGGLGAAISAYLRTVGSSSGLTVHITLDEAPQRFPAATEAELFRITQEAITNARKHARASNLWVTVEARPPRARITVGDDGVGMTAARRQDSYGQSIMRERADRLGAVLQVGDRDGGGTRVAVQLDAPTQTRRLSAAGGRPGRGSSADRPTDR
ncbi:MAG: histidine kinase [Actinomycetota bacterium]|nr:histidine kinase [Actinomycetota bacterium]